MAQYTFVVAARGGWGGGAKEKKKKVQLLKIFKAPCQSRLIFPLFWIKPCEGLGLKSPLRSSCLWIKSTLNSNPKCQILLLGDTSNLFFFTHKLSQISSIALLSKLTVAKSPIASLRPKWCTIQISLFPRGELCAIIRCSHFPHDPLLN